MEKNLTPAHRRFRNALTVEELIARLEDLPGDAVVLFACDYGDYSHTQQALPVEECDQIDPTFTVDESAYSQSKMALSEHECPEYGEPEEIPEDAQKFVILK